MSDDKRHEIDYATYCLILVVIANLFLAAAFIQWRLLSPFLQLVASTREERKPGGEATLILPERQSTSFLNEELGKQ